ncbi:MAG: peptidoglycan DD-metalloendopeptidase family protein [Candidatus Omnitrophica bacterium]|nr:peptidoglycan DD-metalloendopeptidase family protein [Candidatus Omnitrophota bacterium]
MKYVCMIILLCVLIGCAATSSQVISTRPMPSPYRQGVYHTVLRGQTMWRIAKAYNVDISDIVETNRIYDSSKIDVGQRIFIPGADSRIKGALKAPVPISKKGYIWPVKGKVMQCYGLKKDSVANKGIDIAANPGQVVLASRAGKVVFCDEKVKGLGKVIIIDHADGYSTLYAGNSANLVRSGDRVKQAQPIARAGSTGRASRCTLHFQIRKGHKPQNPFYYLP